MKLSFTLLVLAFHLQSNGVNAYEGEGLCRKEANNRYNCGSSRGTALYWPSTTTCTLNECCCDAWIGWDYNSKYQKNTCAYQVNSRIGCFACSGGEACIKLEDTHVSQRSFQEIMTIYNSDLHESLKA